jgi:hypothetical protein
MTEEKKKGILSKLFGAKKSACCGVQIVEVIEEKKKEVEKKETEDKNRSQQTSS